MMKIFICPGCGRMTTGSRKKEMTCSRCGELPMERAKLTFEKFAEMDGQQRQDYSRSWLYIHQTGRADVK
ncbi:MAG: DNA-directed RNA polymerase subunit M [Lachnospiraceae bacterium]|nr:DNA-directed RNA polymerase subunit M [Lachnospiraceae bacterium]MCI9149557.1 DNA-directed RNA polymerase subunit M [Lachnospiraceae bacterium]